MKNRIRRGGNYPSNKKQINLKRRRRDGRNTLTIYIKSLHDPDNHDVVIAHLKPDSWNVKSNGPYEASL